MTSDKAAEQAVMSEVFGAERDSADQSASATESASRERDEQGRFAAKKAADEAKAAEVAATPPVVQNAPPVLEPDPKPTDHRVPLSEVLTEREKRKQESRLREDAEARARQYEQQLMDMQRRFQAQQQPPAPPPDPYTDPEGALSYTATTLEQRFQDKLYNLSEAAARRSYGAEAVEAARKAAIETGAVREFLGRPDAYGDMVEWHKKYVAWKEIGNDPASYKTKLEAELRAKVLEEMKAAQPAVQQPRFPGSLADATQAGQQGGHLTPQAAISSVFAPGRKKYG